MVATEDSVSKKISGSKDPRCIACGSPDPTPSHHAARDYITGQFFEVLKCPRCGLAWTTPTPHDLNPYYPSTYRRYNPIIIFMLKFLYKRRVARWSRRFPTHGRALELGCGDGFMLNALRSLGWEVAGTERTSDMARFAREQFGLTVYVEPEQPIPVDARFNLIILFQVLEHLSDPVTQLRRAASLLAIGGEIIVAVPNISSWQSRFAKDNWFHLDVPRHLVHLSPLSLDHAARKAGLTMRSIEFASFEHDPYGWVQSILNRVFGNGNRLTKLLMRSEKWRAHDVLTITLAIGLVPLAVVLSLLSWICRRGAIMQVTLTREI